MWSDLRAFHASLQWEALPTLKSTCFPSRTDMDNADSYVYLLPSYALVLLLAFGAKHDEAGSGTCVGIAFGIRSCKPVRSSGSLFSFAAME